MDLRCVKLSLQQKAYASKSIVVLRNFVKRMVKSNAKLLSLVSSDCLRLKMHEESSRWPATTGLLGSRNTKRCCVRIHWPNSSGFIGYLSRVTWSPLTFRLFCKQGRLLLSALVCIFLECRNSMLRREVSVQTRVDHCHKWLSCFCFCWCRRWPLLQGHWTDDWFPTLSLVGRALVLRHSHAHHGNCIRLPQTSNH